MTELLDIVAGHASDICTIVTCVALVVKPVRERVLGMGQIREGQRCLLRTEIVRIYYRNRKDKTLHEYEYKNMHQCYMAYKALDGNTFIDHLHAEMLEWEIIQ